MREGGREGGRKRGALIFSPPSLLRLNSVAALMVIMKGLWDTHDKGLGPVGSVGLVRGVQVMMKTLGVGLSPQDTREEW